MNNEHYALRMTDQLAEPHSNLRFNLLNHVCMYMPLGGIHQRVALLPIIRNQRYLDIR